MQSGQVRILCPARSVLANPSAIYVHNTIFFFTTSSTYEFAHFGVREFPAFWNFPKAAVDFRDLQSFMQQHNKH